MCRGSVSLSSKGWRKGLHPPPPRSQDGPSVSDPGRPARPPGRCWGDLGVWVAELTPELSCYRMEAKPLCQGQTPACSTSKMVTGSRGQAALAPSQSPGSWVVWEAGCLDSGGGGMGAEPRAAFQRRHWSPGYCLGPLPPPSSLPGLAAVRWGRGWGGVGGGDKTA